jgi:uncharacterized protein
MSVRFVIIIGVILLAEYYSFVLVRSFVRDFSATNRTVTMAIYLLVTALCLLSPFFIRQFSDPLFPRATRNIIIGFLLGFLIAKLLVLLLLLVDDARRGVMWAINRLSPSAITQTVQQGYPRSLFIRQMALLAAALSVGGLVLGTRNRYAYQVRRKRIKLPDLPAAFQGFKIVQLSDIHTGSFDNHEAVERGIRLALAQQPDMIVFTGDLVNNAAAEVDDKYLALFSLLKAPHGVYSILGNHDYGDYMAWSSEEAKAKNLQALKNIHHQAGWRLLLNEAVAIEKDGSSIGLVGIENWGAKAHFAKYGDLAKAWQQIAGEHLPVHILLSHDPSHWDAQVRPQYPSIDLTLSGHTHGMQFGIDNKLLKWSPVQYIYKQWSGLYQEGTQYLHVNPGFGFIGYPGRVGILPEISVIELV